MKKITLILVLLFISNFVVAQKNLAGNGNFEDWTNSTTPLYWNTNSNVSQNTTDAIEGNSCASLLIDNSDVDARPSVFKKIPLIANKEYTITYKFKYVDSNFGGTHPISLKVERQGSATIINSNRFTSNNNWNTYSTTFTPDQTGEYDLRIGIASFDNEGFNVLIDDVLVFDVTDLTIITIPDVNFKNALLNHTPVIDTNGDGEIQKFEAEALDGYNSRNINVNDKNISDLTGIEAFVNIRAINCRDNNLQQINTKNNKEIYRLDCANNKITSLDLSENKKLSWLLCNSNMLTELDISNNNSLTNLFCDNNLITNLDTSNKQELKYVRCSNNQIKSLDFSNSPKLERLFCEKNKLNSLKIVNCSNLSELSCNNNEITELILPTSNTLKEISCYKNKITTLNLSSVPELTEILCYKNNIQGSLDTSNNAKLQKLWCFENKITELNLSNNTALTSLWCGENNLTSLNLEKNTLLTNLYSENNKIENLNLTKNSNLKAIRCNNNNLVSLNIKNGNNTNITNLVAGFNPNLSCIEVDNKALANSKTAWYKDNTTIYSEDCSATASTNSEFYSTTNLYPNPVENTLIILTNNSQIKRVDIFSILGNKITSTKNTTIDFSKLASGMYILKIRNTDNQEITKKIIKK